MATGPDGGAGSGSKKQRVDDEGDGCEAVAADGIPMDRISALPDDLRRRILTHLPLKDAIRTRALALGWRGLWKSRWAHHASIKVHLHSRDDMRRELEALEQDPLPRHRLDCFSLIAETYWLKSSELRRFIKYTAECRVEDLHVETRKINQIKLNFHMPLSSLALARLSLHCIRISNMYYKGAQPFRALEAIQLYSVSIKKASLRKMMELCPNLLTLDLCGCYIRCDSGICLFISPRVRKVKFVECVGYSKLWLLLMRHVRSFYYSGDVRRGVLLLPEEATMLADLYIRSTNRPVSNQSNFNDLKYSFPKNLPGLKVLTICCNSLPVATSSWLPNRSLHNLKELQLLMLEMEAINLADLYVFLKTCNCPNLERIFVQFPISSHEPTKRPTDVVREEPPQDGFDNLAMVKVMNFNWRPIEVQLVSFLLRKASSIHKLLIVSPNVAPLDLPGAQDGELCLLKEALAYGKIILSESDDAATQPYHSEAIIKF